MQWATLVDSSHKAGHKLQILVRNKISPSRLKIVYLGYLDYVW